MSDLYYTNIENNNNSFVGIVYSSNNNQVIYRTTEYSDQSQAIKDANNFIRTKNKPTKPVAYTNTIKTLPVHQPSVSGRCCGR